MIIKVLGTGCSKCKKLEQETIKAVKETGIEATIEKVTELKDIMEYGVMMTPALVIDEKIVSSGRLIYSKEIIKLIKG